MEYLIFWLLFGITAAIIANSKGRNGFRWFCIGALFGPFSLMVAALPSLKLPPGAPTPETHVVCPDCAELIRKEARVCKHCGCRIAQPGKASVSPERDFSPDTDSFAYRAGKIWAKIVRRL
jgi:hypothetical protein